MKELLAQFFIWWHGQTWGTRFAIWRGFTEVGTDDFGNRYFQSKTGDRRWVVYNGPAEASMIPPGWYGWMQHKTDILPTDENYVPRPWQKPHQPNMTGTAFAYRPDGSLAGKGERPRVTGDYEAWSPE